MASLTGFLAIWLSFAKRLFKSMSHRTKPVEENLEEDFRPLRQTMFPKQDISTKDERKVDPLGLR